MRGLASRGVLVVAVLTAVAALRPRRWARLDLLGDLAPGLVPATAGPALLLAATALLITARGLRRGHRLAWAATLVVLAGSVVLHLVHALNVPAALVAGGLAVWLATQRDAFPVLPTLSRRRRLVVVAVTVVAAVAAVAVLAGLLAADPDVLVRAHVVRAVHRAEAGLALVFVAALAWSLLLGPRPARSSGSAHRAERERARQVVRRHGSGSLDYFALRDDKDWFFVGQTVVAHATRGGVCVVSPDPIGPADERVEAWSEFLRYASGFGWSVAVLGASPQWLPVYEASGLRTTYLGDEAVVDCPAFSLAGGDRKSLRQAVNRVARGGWTTSFFDPLELPADLRAQVLSIADESRRGETERGFSMTLSRLFDPDDTGLLLSVTCSADGRVDAFCQWAPAPGIDGWSLDVMRRRLDVDDLPNGLVDATVVATIEEVARRGQHGLSLNFAVLREVLSGEPEGVLDSLVRPLLLRLSQATQLSSLASFNDKFGPQWSPRYVVLDAPEFVAAQALVMADAEGVTELPVIGRFLSGLPRR